MKQDYFLGLDMGTGSLGWAVTDSTYQVMRKHGKALWGTRLFESASTAEERGCLGQQGEGWTDEIGEFRCCRRFFQKKYQKLIRDFSYE